MPSGNEIASHFHHRLADAVSQRKIQMNIRLDDLWRRTRDPRKIRVSERQSLETIDDWRQRMIVKSGLPCAKGNQGVMLRPLDDPAWLEVTGYHWGNEWVEL